MTRPRTRSGWRPARAIATYPPSDSPTTTARPPAASSIAPVTTRPQPPRGVNAALGRVPCPGRSTVMQRYRSRAGPRPAGTRPTGPSIAPWTNTIAGASAGPGDRPVGARPARRAPSRTVASRLRPGRRPPAPAPRHAPAAALDDRCAAARIVAPPTTWSGRSPSAKDDRGEDDADDRLEQHEDPGPHRRRSSGCRSGTARTAAPR